MAVYSNVCTLSALMQEVKSKSQRAQFFNNVLKLAGDGILKQRKAGRGGGAKRSPSELWMDKETYQRVSEIVRSRIPTPETAGFVYGFELKYHRGHYKFGKAKIWTRRKKGYTGHNAVGRMVLLKPTQDRHQEEKELLKFVSTIMQREEFGNEWFKTKMNFSQVQAELARR